MKILTQIRNKISKFQINFFKNYVEMVKVLWYVVFNEVVSSFDIVFKVQAKGTQYGQTKKIIIVINNGAIPP
jgi:RNAse (barnase) inhibitor barstar